MSQPLWRLARSLETLRAELDRSGAGPIADPVEFNSPRVFRPANATQARHVSAIVRECRGVIAVWMAVLAGRLERVSSIVVDAWRDRLKMAGVNAAFVAAQVIDVVAGRNRRAAKEFIGPPVSDSFLAVHAKLPVSGVFSSTNPYPTLRLVGWNSYLFEETYKRRGSLGPCHEKGLYH